MSKWPSPRYERAEELPRGVVGSTRFYEVATWRWPDGSPHQRAGVPDVVDIEFTWLAASARRSPVNTEAKLLMLRHAFEVGRSIGWG